MSDLLACDDRGIACRPSPLGEPAFHIDPWKPVPIAVITHAHSDHARPGSGRFFCASPCLPFLRRRIHPGAEIVPVPFGEVFHLGGVEVSFHPAGHIRGSAQIRVSDGRRVWVASGDYKRDPDPTAEPFEVVRCDAFITEATFALPVYTWRAPGEVAGDIAAWWSDNRAQRRVSVLFMYSLGKAQRVLAEVARHVPGMGGVERPVYAHGAVQPMIEAYREAGVDLPATRLLDEGLRSRRPPSGFVHALVIAPPSAAGSAWMRRFGPPASISTGFVSGWMQVRGVRRRRGYDRGFVMSDHADWNGLVRTVVETGATRVLATHGRSEVLARYLRELGIDAGVLRTDYNAEDEEPDVAGEGVGGGVGGGGGA
jgi:putative mRNA 3-end processing factor